MTTTTKVKYRYEIEQSERFDCPRDYDNVGTMALFHGRYNLPNESLLDDHDDYETWDEMRKELIRVHDVFPSCILPVYMYDHSGLTINTTGFSCSWDSGQIGFIFIDKKTLKEYGWTKKQGIETIKSEIDTFDQYSRGDVWDIKIYQDDKLIDTHYEVYGYDYAESEAIAWIDSLNNPQT
jgi:hypothetical protein